MASVVAGVTSVFAGIVAGHIFWRFLISLKRTFPAFVSAKWAEGRLGNAVGRSVWRRKRFALAHRRRVTYNVREIFGAGKKPILGLPRT